MEEMNETLCIEEIQDAEAGVNMVEVAQDEQDQSSDESTDSERDCHHTEDDFAEEVKALQSIYPDFDMAQFEENQLFHALLKGEVRPTLKQVYEMLCPQVLTAQVEAEVQNRVTQALEHAVAEAVERAEKNLLSHIQARGMRPQENGKNASSGVRTHPAVHRLTREDRAKLAKMAQQGETVRL